jgi:hypothetical protein
VAEALDCVVEVKCAGPFDPCEQKREYHGLCVGVGEPVIVRVWEQELLNILTDRRDRLAPGGERLKHVVADHSTEGSEVLR